uniref:Nanog homeobox n=1 Tax=Echeneis naucrates TaxID=173247 RepID=A0A665X5I3_ECHNA
MADWKAQISYNYNPSYHAYAYGLVYQPAPEQNHGNLTYWGEAGVGDLSSFSTGVTPAYYAPTARAREQSPPASPEQHAMNSHHRYQSSGVLYLGDTQAGRMLLGKPHRTPYDSRGNGVRRAGSDSTSDSEVHTSPELWSSSSTTREGNLSQTDPAVWAKDDEVSSRNPTDSKEVDSSVMEEPQTFTVEENESINITPLHVPITAPNKLSTGTNPKSKVRAAFSESQMNALVQRFSVQRYLTPAEMKNLAELTGLTYKQVKTWFQNRRMKLRRHQKDNSWVSERYTLNKDSSVHGTVYANIPSHIPTYQGEALPQLKEHYNQHMMEAALKKPVPQNLAFYLASIGNAPGPAGYPSWSSTSSQTAVHSRPQPSGWPMPPGVSHYEYNPNVFNSSSAASTGHNMSFETKDQEPVNS